MSPSNGGDNRLEKQFLRCVDLLVGANLPQFEFLRASATGCNVGKARNILAAYGLAKDVDAILCWDRDVWLAGTDEQVISQVVRLLSWPSDLGNIAALYSIKNEEAARWVLTPLPNERRQSNGLLRVQESGTGLKVLWAWQIKAIIKAFPQIEYTSDDANYGSKMWDLFSMGPVPCGNTKRYLSEDYYYDYRLRLFGYDVWVDTGVITIHRGETPDGRVIDFPPYPLPKPGLSPDGGTERYPGEQRRFPFSLDRDSVFARSVAYFT
jgi:hypothetical protein